MQNAPAFDISSIQDAAWQKRYAQWSASFKQTAQSIKKVYGLDGRDVRVSFVSLPHANATVRRNGDAYDVQIGSAFPYLLTGLFRRIMAEEDVMDWLPVETNPIQTDTYSVVMKPSQLQSEVMHTAAPLSPERDFVAQLLTEIAIKFVVFHEFGHVVSGHCDVPEAVTQKLTFDELSIVKRDKSRPLRRAWEVDADLAGLRLTRDFFDGMIQSAKDAEPDSLQRRVFGPQQIAVEQCASLTTMALYCLFRHLGETRTQLDMHGDHPDPLVRALCIRNALIPDTMARYQVDDELMTDILEGRFEEFDDALEAIGIHSAMTIDDDGIDAVNDALSVALKENRDHQAVAKPYSWIGTKL